MAAFRFPNESAEYRRRRDALLEREIELRDQIEAVAAERRALPLGGRLKEDYRFERVAEDGQACPVAFSELFGEHDSLIIYSMMFGPEWDAPCPSCASIVDSINVNGRAVRETTALAVVAAARVEQLEHWGRRRGWSNFVLASALNNDYLLDYCAFPDATDPALVSALNAFKRTPDGIFHTWGSELAGRPMANGHPRHVDMIWPLWNLLDVTPGGRGDAVVPKQDYEHRYFTENVLGGS
jgi:predicted dithiol-disulfide oxidoreductase (DUF899 family)